MNLLVFLSLWNVHDTALKRISQSVCRVLAQTNLIKAWSIPVGVTIIINDKSFKMHVNKVIDSLISDVFAYAFYYHSDNFIGNKSSLVLGF